ncbi:hypothetical protein CEXT_392741 [Caerostris extrusa]|uniref:Uncharacterized protein n=1 Tax=Caerostris extrusa TaxID=172846 RepID=A0AAV4MRS1_CAEEX|nr:hypothetical protein CEXT_392741 [Caerostris extrusa]
MTQPGCERGTWECQSASHLSIQAPIPPFPEQLPFSSQSQNKDGNLPFTEMTVLTSNKCDKCLRAIQFEAHFVINAHHSQIRTAQSGAYMIRRRVSSTRRSSLCKGSSWTCAAAFTPLSIRERGVMDEKTRIHFITMFNAPSPPPSQVDLL